jgi:hypothetical protein
MYFILLDKYYSSSGQHEVIEYYTDDDLEEMVEKYPRLAWDRKGCYGFNSEYYENNNNKAGNIYFVGLKGFLTKEYKKQYPDPPNKVLACIKYLRSQRIDDLIDYMD